MHIWLFNELETGGPGLHAVGEWGGVGGRLVRSFFLVLGGVEESDCER